MTDYNSPPSPSTTLRRSDDQRIFAGVCGGLGKHFGVNAWWFRWAFIILAFFGFAGIAIYIAAWLLIPDAGSSESIAGGWFDDLDMSDTGTLFGVVLIGVAALIIATSVFHISGAIVIAVALGIVGFLLYRGDIRPPVKTPPTVDPPTVDEDTIEVIEDGDIIEVVEVDTVTTPADETAAGVAASVAATSVATKPPRPPKPPKEKKPRPPKSMLGRLTMAVMLIVLSSMALIELTDLVHFQPYEYAAAAMGVVAVGLLAGAWIGRAYWLIVIGLLIAPVLFFSSLLPNIADWSAGDPHYTPTSAEEVPESYDLGAGQLTIDLTQLSADDLVSEVGVIKASVSLGQLIVRLPSNVGATVKAEVGVGELTGGEIYGSVLVDVYEYSGVNVDQIFTIGPAPHDLLLNLEVGAGEISIQYVGEPELGVNESKG